MSVTDEYLKNNAEYARSFTGPLPLPPSKHVAVVSCMDARLDVYRILGLGAGEAHVIRNAGGVITDDEIRSLAISQRLLGTRDIILIHHTDCGMLTFTDDDFKQSIQQDTGIKPEWAAEAFPDLEEDVRQSLRRIEVSPFVTKHESARGFIFDVASTSVLKRAIRTLWIVLDRTDQMWLPIHCCWELNERHYGALQALNKKRAEEQYGKIRFKPGAEVSTLLHRPALRLFRSGDSLSQL